MANSSEGPLKLGTFLIISGGALLIQGLKRMSTVTKIRDTPLANIRSAPQGLVELQGHALPVRDEYLSVLGRSTVCKELLIQERVRRGKSSTWETRLHEKEGERFIFSDGTGIAEVRIEDAEIHWEEFSCTLSEMSDTVRVQLIEKYGAQVPGLGGRGLFGFFKKFRVIEKIIPVGGPIYVRGFFRTNFQVRAHVLSPRHQRFLGNVAILRADPAARKRFYDVNRDQRIDEKELQHGAVRLLQRAALAIQPGDVDEPVRVDGVLAHTKEHGLIIATSHQEHVIKRLGGNNALRIVGGALAVAAGIGVLISAF